MILKSTISQELYEILLDKGYSEQLIKRVTEVSSEIMNVSKEFFSMTIKELPNKNFGIGGKTIDHVKEEYMKAYQQGASHHE